MIFNDTISFFLESGLVMMVLYAYYHMFWKNSGAFHIRRAILLFIPLVAIVIPALSFSAQIPGYTIPTINLQEVVLSGNERVNSSAIFSWLNLITLIYLTGASLFLLHWFKSFGSIIRIIKSSFGRMKSQNGYWIVNTGGKMPTFSFFNLIFWNDQEKLNHVQSDMILKHEKAHIRHFHSLDVMLISIFKVIFWFIPVVHWIEKELSLVHEYTADEEATRNHPKDEYIQLLANQTLYHMKHQWIQSFNKGPLLKRFEALEKPALMRSRGGLLLLAPILSVLILVFSCESTPNVETVEESSTKVEEALTQVDQMPEFEGGMEAMISFLSKNITYPKSAEKEGLEGKVFVQFEIEKDGSIKYAEVVRGFDPACDEEALRVVKSMPNWKPGKNDGQVVRTRLTLPIAFALAD